MNIHKFNLKDDTLVLERQGRILSEDLKRIRKKTDRSFRILMLIQWLAGIVAACIISPHTWIGAQEQTHIHIYMAIFLCGLIMVFPVVLSYLKPGEKITRYSFAIAQVLESSLLIHLTGGRIETHFHVFGSLAFLASYRDRKVLYIATAIVALDHFFRGVYWPQSVFGIVTASEWRWVEHAAWVIFELIFLINSINQSRQEMKLTALRQAEMEGINEIFEKEVLLCTKELKESNEELESFAFSASHDMKEPLRGISSYADLLYQKNLESLDARSLERLQKIQTFCLRLKNVISALLEYSQVGNTKICIAEVDLKKVAYETQDTIKLACGDQKVDIKIDENLPLVFCDENGIGNILYNLVINGIKHNDKEEKIIEIGVTKAEEIKERLIRPFHFYPTTPILYVKDNGIGIKEEYYDKVFKIFQKLDPEQKAEKGSGAGLTIVNRIIKKHSGVIFIDSELGKGSTFYFTLG